MYIPVYRGFESLPLRQFCIIFSGSYGALPQAPQGWRKASIGPLGGAAQRPQHVAGILDAEHLRDRPARLLYGCLTHDMLMMPWLPLAAITWRALPGLLDGDDAVLEQVGRSPVAQAAGAARTPISARPWPAWALPM